MGDQMVCMPSTCLLVTFLPGAFPSLAMYVPVDLYSLLTLSRCCISQFTFKEPNPTSLFFHLRQGSSLEAFSNYGTCKVIEKIVPKDVKQAFLYCITIPSDLHHVY